MHDDFYQMYLEEMKAITPCTQEENTQLLNDAAAGNEGAKKRLIEGNLEAALTCAKAYDGKGVLLTDLVAEANMALTMAVTEFLTNPGDGDFEGFLTARMKEALDLAVEEEESAEQTGEELAAMCYEAGIDVTSLPGPAACITALTLSGLPTRRFAFEAFLPMDKKERIINQPSFGRTPRGVFHFRFFPGFFFKSAIKYASFFFFIVLFHI